MAVEFGALPFKEQLAFFRAKLNLPTKRWDDLLGAAHDRAFVVAGAMKADLLMDLRNAVDRVISGKTTLEAFRKDFKQIVAQRGWTGWTGQGTKAGEAWRTRVIYDTNLFTGYSAGRYQQMQDVKALRPWWRYRHSDAVVHPRLEHVAWDRKILHADDPWWKSHHPPNGFGCKCFVESLADRDLERLGIPKPPMNRGESMPFAGLNPKTGLPQGIDKGWDYAPGRTWFPDMDKYDYATAKQMIAANMADGVFDRWHQFIALRVAEELKKPEYAGLDKKALNEPLRKALSQGESYPVAALSPEMKNLLGVDTQTVLLSDWDLIKQQVSRAGQNFDAVNYLAAQGVLDNPRLVVRENDQMTIFVSDTAGRWYAAVVQQTKTGKGLFLKSFRYSSEKDARLQKKKGVVLVDAL
ncbi:MAG: hypothetical protein QG599_3305 [Pseudomonadota bacterium]|jgi:hypothetical protein|nr:hypothetical protein [Pseudomonadota bacterium]